MHPVQENLEGSSLTTAGVGLREQKRIETRYNIEDSATRLVDERGFSDVTVEQICEAAGISRRTFFNYFESKDDAILGTSVGSFTDEHRDFLINTPTTNMVDLVLTMVEKHFEAHEKKTEIWERRQRIANDPQAAALLMHRRRATSMQVVDIVAEHFEHLPEDRQLPDIPARAEAMIVGSTVREAMWLAMACPSSGCADSPLHKRFKPTAQLLTSYAKGLTW